MNFNEEAACSLSLLPHHQRSFKTKRRLLEALPVLPFFLPASTFGVEHDREKHPESPGASPAARCRHPLVNPACAASRVRGWKCGAL